MTSATQTRSPALAVAGNGGSGNPNTRVVGIACLLLLAGAIFLDHTANLRQASLLILGSLFGVVLYHAAFGFTSAWRVFISDGRGAGLRAQMLMLAVGALLFFPALDHGTLFGHAVKGNVDPVGTALLVGSFLFGLGMQLGGGCASGTLYTVGGGNSRMVLTLLFFVIGSAIGTYHFAWWESLPGLKPYSFITHFGLAPALLLNFVVFALIFWLTKVVERRRHGRIAPIGTVSGTRPQHLLRGPWPLVWGALGLAVLNFATLAIAGKPWGVTSAFALWGSKAAQAIGFNVDSWGYWAANAGRHKALHASLFKDITTALDIGVILGAMAAAGMAQKFAPKWRIPFKSALAAAIGGALMGYGARLALGCNIGAYFSGIVSASLSGWVWMICAFAGSILGTRLRPLFGLEVEKSKPTGC